MPHAPAAKVQSVRARRLFGTELMVGAPLEKDACFLHPASDPSGAAIEGRWSVDPRPAAFPAAPSISPSGFSVTMITPRRRRLSDLRARKDSQGRWRWVCCAPRPAATSGLGDLRRGPASTTAGRESGLIVWKRGSAP